MNAQLSFCRLSVSFIPDKKNKHGFFLLVVRDISEARNRLLNEVQLEVVKSTLNTVNDIIFNYLQGLLLFRTTCEESCKSPYIDFKLFDNEYHSTLNKLKKINTMSKYKEKKFSDNFSLPKILDPE